MNEFTSADAQELLDTADRYAAEGDAAYARAFAAYEGAHRRLTLTIVATLVATVFALAGLAMFLHAAGAPTLHTRRITAGGQTVSLEIPDGQCATALGVTICVPSPGKVSP